MRYVGILALATIAFGADLAFNGKPLKTSKPLQAKNLTIIFLSGADTIGAEFATLDELASKGLVEICECKKGATVPLVEIENKSKRDLYIQAGETILGGRQDRVIKCDTMIPAKTKVLVAVYCVEQSRWKGSSDFQGDKRMPFIAPTRGLRYYVQHKCGGQQSKVWDEVEEAKRKAAGAFGTGRSETSSVHEELEKALSNEDFKELVRCGKENEVPQDALGAIFVANGDLLGFDVYASHDIFVKQFPKLLNSAAFEALLESKSEKKKPDYDVMLRWVKWALDSLSLESARGVYEGGLPQFELIVPSDNRTVFAYVFEKKWLHAQAVKYAPKE